MTASPNSLVRPVPQTEARLEPLRPMPVATVRRAMEEYQQGLNAILGEGDVQRFRNRRGEQEEFPKRSGWRKIATWFGLDGYVGHTEIDRDEHGQILRARVTARVVAPNGRTWENNGAATLDEGGWTRPEHDIISTATTRALSRATSDLVGFGKLSAEEVPAEVDAAPAALPEWAQTADEHLNAAMLSKLAELVGVERAQALQRAIAERYDGVPNIATGFVNALHSMLAAELQRLRSAPYESEAGSAPEGES